MHSIMLAVCLQTQAGSIEKTAMRIKPSSAYRVVVRMHLVLQVKGLRGVADYLPSVFVYLRNFNILLAL